MSRFNPAPTPIDYRTIAFEPASLLSKAQLINQLPYKTSNFTVIEDFSDPTGWTGTADTLDGDNARSVTASGSAAALQKDYNVALAIGQYVLFKIYVEDPAKLASLTLYFAKNDSYTNCFARNVTSSLIQGVNIFVFHRSAFAIVGTPAWNDVDLIRILASPKAGETVKVSVSRIQTYEMTPRCTIWFDDGHLTQYSEAYTYMATKSMPGVISVLTSLVGTASHFTEENMRTMIQAGWEMVNHTRDHKNLTTVTIDEAEVQIAEGMKYLSDKGAGKGAYHMVAPQGGRNAAIDRIIKKYAVTSRRAAGYNLLPIGVCTSPWALAVREVKSNTPVSTVTGWIDDAIANDYWIILLFHYLQDPADVYTKYLPTDFQSIIDYLDTNKASIKTVTVSEALSLV